MGDSQNHSLVQGQQQAAPVIVSRSVLLVIGAACLVLLWVLSCNQFRSPDALYSAIGFTTLIFLSLSAIAIEFLAPQVSIKIKLLVLCILSFKIIVSIVYFHSFFVHRTGDVVMIEPYGDSVIHHYAGLKFLDHWVAGDSTIRNLSATSVGVAEWGYGFFLSMLYYATGADPEKAVIVNGFLAFIACLLGYRLFLLGGVEKRQASLGLCLLVSCPSMWLWSSVLYKDSLLIALVLATTIVIIKLLREFRLSLWIIATALLVLLVPLRYSYTLPLLVVLSLGAFYVRHHSLRESWLLCGLGTISLGLVLAVTQQVLLDASSVLDSAWTVLNLKPTGGRFMTHGIGSYALSGQNFYYVLPAKALYILMIPMPWFGGETGLERIDYLVSHLDAFYYFTLLAALALVLFTKRTGPFATKERNVLLVVGLMFFVIPLFFFFPSRRYLTISIPFFLAYALPGLADKKVACLSLIGAVAVIATIQIAYYWSGPLIR